MTGSFLHLRLAAINHVHKDRNMHYNDVEGNSVPQSWNYQIFCHLKESLVLNGVNKFHCGIKSCNSSSMRTSFFHKRWKFILVVSCNHVRKYLIKGHFLALPTKFCFYYFNSNMQMQNGNGSKTSFWSSASFFIHFYWTWIPPVISEPVFLWD